MGIKFTLTKEHLILLKNAHFDPCGDFKTPVLDTKRPLGDSDVVASVAALLKWFGTDDIERAKETLDNMAEDMKERKAAKAFQLLEQLTDALQIVTCCQTFRAGKFIKKDQYDSLSWERVE